MTHVPTGISVKVMDERYEKENRKVYLFAYLPIAFYLSSVKMNQIRNVLNELAIFL